MADSLTPFEAYNFWEFDNPFLQHEHERLARFILLPENDRTPYSVIKDGVRAAATDAAPEWSDQLVDYLIDLDVARWIFASTDHVSVKRATARRILSLIQTALLFGDPPQDTDTDYSE